MRGKEERGRERELVLSTKHGRVCTEHRAWSRTKSTPHVSRNCVRFRIVVIRFEPARRNALFFAGMFRVTFQSGDTACVLHSFLHICVFFFCTIISFLF